MSQTARVTSLDALKQFRAAWCTFGEEIAEALTSTEMEIQRQFAWLEQQTKYWQREIRNREDEVTRAKAELRKRKMFKVLDRIPDCSEQEKDLRRAQMRLEEAEIKLKQCRRWIPILKREVEEYEGPARQLAGLLETALPRSLAWLDARLDALDAYIRLAPPPGQGGAEIAPSSTSPPERQTT